MPNEDKVNVKLEETFCDKYSLAVIVEFVLVKDGYFSIDFPAFLLGKNRFYGTAEVIVSPRPCGDRMRRRILQLK